MIKFIIKAILAIAILYQLWKAKKNLDRCVNKWETTRCFFYSGIYGFFFENLEQFFN